MYEQDEGFVPSEIYLVNTLERRRRHTQLLASRGREQSPTPPHFSALHPSCPHFSGRQCLKGSTDRDMPCLCAMLVPCLMSCLCQSPLCKENAHSTNTALLSGKPSPEPLCRAGPDELQHCAEVLGTWRCSLSTHTARAAHHATLQ